MTFYFCFLVDTSEKNQGQTVIAATEMVKGVFSGAAIANDTFPKWRSWKRGVTCFEMRMRGGYLPNFCVRTIHMRTHAPNIEIQKYFIRKRYKSSIYLQTDFNLIDDFNTATLGWNDYAHTRTIILFLHLLIIKYVLLITS